MPNAAHLAASARLADSNTMFADFPPSSKLTFFKLVCAAAMAIARPVAVDPVNAILSISMCSESALPTLDPSPFTKLKVPAGKPTLLKISANFRVERVVVSAGLKTIVQPAASAGPIFLHAY